MLIIYIYIYILHYDKLSLSKIWKQKAKFTEFQVVAIGAVDGNILSHFVKDWPIISSTVAQKTTTVGGESVGVWALDHPLTFYSLWTESETIGTA
jgi:hypothetical protein